LGPNPSPEELAALRFIIISESWNDARTKPTRPAEDGPNDRHTIC
jgi:hypothetical protein